MVFKYVFVMVDQLRMWPFVANNGESVDVTTGNLRTKMEISSWDKSLNQMVDVPPQGI